MKFDVCLAPSSGCFFVSCIFPFVEHGYSGDLQLYLCASHFHSFIHSGNLYSASSRDYYSEVLVCRYESADLNVFRSSCLFLFCQYFQVESYRKFITRRRRKLLFSLLACFVYLPFKALKKCFSSSLIHTVIHAIVTSL